MSGIGERLKILRAESSQIDFALKFGIHRNTLARWESEEREPDVSFLVHLAEQKHVALKWLLTGVGHMHEGTSEPPSDNAGSEKAGDASPIQKMQPPKNTRLQKNKMSDGRPLGQETNALPAELNALNKELRELLRENGDLRVQASEMKGQIRDLERKLREALKPEKRQAPLENAG